MTTKKMLSKEERRDAALKIALQLAKKVGASRVSLAAVAAKQGITAPLLFHIFESRELFTKALLKLAKKEGVTLPDGEPTVREKRAKKLAPLKKPQAVKKLAPLPVKKPTKKVAALLKPKGSPTAPVSMTVKAKKGEDLRKLSPTELVTRGARKPLTEAQRQAKAARDKARRAPVSTPAPTTPAGKFASLPKPFEASVAAVAA